MNTAKNNTTLFEKIFGGRCFPSDSVKTFDELQEFRVWYHLFNKSCNSVANYLQKLEGLANTDIEGATKLLSQIKGHLIEFPHHFLENQELKKTLFPLPVDFFQ